MRVALLTREYPPEVYGGAGVHVEYLARELSAAGGSQRALLGRRSATDPAVHAYRPWARCAAARRTSPRCRRSRSTCSWPAGVEGADVVHSHTWYAQFAGHLAKLIHDIPHVATVHSLEPLRPWKAEQLGGGYALSSFCERIGARGCRRGHRRLAGLEARHPGQLPGHR